MEKKLTTITTSEGRGGGGLYILNWEKAIKYFKIFWTPHAFGLRTFYIALYRKRFAP